MQPRGQAPGETAAVAFRQPLASLPSVALVVPVYNERSTLPSLLPAVFEQTPGLSLDVWVVDDGSPDGTADVVRALTSELPRLHLLERRRAEGRGAAVIDAFGFLLAPPPGLGRPGGEVRGVGGGVLQVTLGPGASRPLAAPSLIAEMDGDGSHDPAHLAVLVAAASAADLALGSRYVDGGEAVLSSRRKLLSRLANGFARAVLRLPYRDCSTGYRCYRRAALSRLDLGALRCGGHATHLEMLFLLHRQGARVHEVPIVYRPRGAGRSKVTIREVLRVTWTLTRLRLRHAAQGTSRS